MKSFIVKQRIEVDPIEFDWGRLYWFVSAPIGNSAEQTFGKCVLKPECANPRHFHPNCEEILHVAEGSIDHFIEGEGWIPMEPGDTITIAQGVWHCARNRGVGEAVLYISFSSAHRETVGED